MWHEKSFEENKWNQWKMQRFEINYHDKGEKYSGFHFHEMNEKIPLKQIKSVWGLQ